MGEQIQTVWGCKVVAFKLHAKDYMVFDGKAYVKRPGCKVELWVDRAGAAVPASTMWVAGIHCNERIFTTTDGARKNVLRAFGHIMER